MKNVNSRVTGKIFDIGNYIFLALFFIICIYPFYYILIYSFSDPSGAQKGITLVPRGFTIYNYITIFKLEGIYSATVVSCLRTALGALISILACSFFSYILTKDELPLKKVIYRYLVVTMYFNAGLIPWYLTMKLYHLNNSFFLYIIPGAISGFYVILLKTYIEQLPPALEESAKIDGAGYFILFRKIIFPLSKPIIATILVFSAVAQWNTWVDNYFLVQNPKLTTLQLILYNYLNQANVLATASNQERAQGITIKMTPNTIRMTITMVVTLPIIFIYPLMQRYFVKGIMIGAIKG